MLIAFMTACRVRQSVLPADNGSRNVRIGNQFVGFHIASLTNIIRFARSGQKRLAASICSVAERKTAARRGFWIPVYHYNWLPARADR